MRTFLSFRPFLSLGIVPPPRDAEAISAPKVTSGNYYRLPLGKGGNSKGAPRLLTRETHRATIVRAGERASDLLRPVSCYSVLPVGATGQRLPTDAPLLRSPSVYPRSPKHPPWIFGGRRPTLP